MFDYGVGDLWKRGIDGAGTTIAVLEGWDNPGVTKTLAILDKAYGLPTPKVTTIFPAGPLPSTCPPGMASLGDYGSCDAWESELAGDVFIAHLIAPYAKIVISVTPAGRQDDAASQIAMPEMIKALEVISSRHIAHNDEKLTATERSVRPQRRTVTGESLSGGSCTALPQTPGSLDFNVS